MREWLGWPVPRWAALLGLVGTAGVWLLDVSFIYLGGGVGWWAVWYHVGLGVALASLWVAALKGF